jgi:glycerol-3-phosphate dehydrogenase
MVYRLSLYKTQRKRVRKKEEFMYDAIIIGSGISGASLAYELAAYKLRIAVIEKGSDICSGTSRGNSATVHSGHDAAYGTQKALYNVMGNAMFDQLCSDLKVPFIRNGTILFAINEADMEEVRRLKHNADKNHVPGVEVLDRDGLLRIEHYFGPDVIGGLYAPTGGIVCPYTLVIALCEQALRNHVDFFLNNKVMCIQKNATGFFVTTNKTVFQTRFLFNCAGTHADEINNMVSSNKITILPRKGEHILLDKKLAPYVRATISQTPVNLPSGGHTKGMGIMPSVDKTIILGCDAHDVTDKDDTATTAIGLDEITSYFEKNWRHLPISEKIPKFPHNRIINAFGGLRPHSTTDDFIIGESEDVAGFFNMAGIESPGLTAAPAIQDAAEKYHFEKTDVFIPTRDHVKPFRDMNDEERRQAVMENKEYGDIVCRCEMVTKAEIKAAIHAPLGATNVNAVKMRTRAGMGRCQGGFCSPVVAKILAEELSIDLTEVTQSGEGSNIFFPKNGNQAKRNSQ